MLYRHLQGWPEPVHVCCHTGRCRILLLLEISPWFSQSSVSPHSNEIETFIYSINWELLFAHNLVILHKTELSSNFSCSTTWNGILQGCTNKKETFPEPERSWPFGIINIISSTAFNHDGVMSASSYTVELPAWNWSLQNSEACLWECNGRSFMMISRSGRLVSWAVSRSCKLRLDVFCRDRIYFQLRSHFE